MKQEGGMVFELTTEFPFGAHVGETVAEVIETDPDYIRYAIENWDNHVFTDEVEQSLPDE